MSSNILVFKVRGMTCVSCEKRVVAAVSTLPGVVSVTADQSRGRVEVHFEADANDRLHNIAAVRDALETAGYRVSGLTDGRERPAYLTVVVIAVGAIAAFLLVNAQGWFNFLPTIDSSIGLGMIFVAGLLTSVHCVAMCGGIALSQQTRVVVQKLDDGSTSTEPASRFRASLGGLQYHAGRIVSYTILGGIVGALGSVFSFSPVTKGILAGIAGLFMVFIGLRMLGLLPRISTIRVPGLYRLLSPKIITALRGRGPFFVGLLNGFMPCGPLQTMQLYALGTGSAALGALSMLLFSAGTVPLMFLFGALSSFFTPRWQGRLIKASAILVVFFGVVMAGRALELSGASGMVKTAFDQATGSSSSITAVGGSDVVAVGGSASGGTTVATIKDGIQYVSFDLKPSSYEAITVQKGLPVRWTINVTRENLNGCNGEIVVPQLNLRKKLVLGANIIEFTANTAGTVSYSCWMGMINSSIKVVDKLGGSAVKSPQPAAPTKISLQSSANGACCSTGSSSGFAGGAIPLDSIQKAVFRTEGEMKYQEVTITVDEKGYSPAVVVLQKDVLARINFKPVSIDGCNRYVDFPDFNGGLDLSSNKTATPLIPVTRDFTFQCGMDMLHGYVRVVDNLETASLSDVRVVVASYKPEPAKSGAGMSCCGPRK